MVVAYSILFPRISLVIFAPSSNPCHDWRIQATLGVQEIHSKGFVHMDIKSENIMLNCIDQKLLSSVRP